jgi:hypothetical protein
MFFGVVTLLAYSQMEVCYAFHQNRIGISAGNDVFEQCGLRLQNLHLRLYGVLRLFRLDPLH